jgi:two-component system, NarL family, invasion response regulator UvrY
MKITLAFADDHISLRQSLAQTLDSLGSFETLFEANNGKDFLNRLETSAILPDICVLDLKMPAMDGLATLSEIRKIYPTLKVIIYSMFLDTFNFLQVYKNGANGAISKDEELEELIHALEVTHQRGLYIPAKIETEIRVAIRNKSIILPNISQREKQFLQLYCEGISQREIATAMNVSIRTVDTYRDHLVQKLGIKSRNGLLIFALTTGIGGWKI